MSVRLTGHPSSCPAALLQGLWQCPPWLGASPAPSGVSGPSAAPGGLAVRSASPGG